MTTEQPKKPTLEEIASHSGVSPATVSRVINQSRAVSKDSEQRVKQALEDLGFTPKRPRARSKPFLIGLITPGASHPTAAIVIAGAQDEANKLGLCLVVIDVTEQPGYQTPNLCLLKHLPLDGLIHDHAFLNPADLVRQYHIEEIPAVVISQFIDSPRFYCINSNRENGMYQAAKYLLSLNHREIAYITSNPEVEISKARLRGIQRALTEAGLALKPEFYRWGMGTIDEGFQATSSILSQAGDHRPTAIIAFNDLLAIGAMHACRAFGLNVPHDISVVGFDDTYFAPHTNPPLTTVSQPKYREGQLAVQKIYNNLHGYDTDKGGFTLLECPLVVRESTGVCKNTQADQGR